MKLLYILLSFGCVLHQIDSEPWQEYVHGNSGLNNEFAVKHISPIDWNKEMCNLTQLLPVTDRSGRKLNTCGEKVLVERFALKPDIEISQEDKFKGKKLTLIMVDPDAPTRSAPICRSWLHWIVTDIANGKGSKVKEVTKYNPPTPPKKSGFHRYYFLLFEQTDVTKIIKGPRNSCGFDVSKFVNDFALKGPLALNMFRTKK